MRKPSRLSPGELAPYQWKALGDAGYARWGDGPGLDTEHPEQTPLTDPISPIVWAELFGNNHPVEIEVGFGKGLYLVNVGTRRPDRNFFGIEIIRKYQMYATNRIAVRKLANVKTCCADAKKVFRESVTSGTVAAVHVYFPDPWWKNRHKKRLLFTADFALEVLRILQPDGVLYFVSDVPEYFEMVTETLAQVTAFHKLPPPDESAPQHDMDYLTNFERKFRKVGKPIHRSQYQKITSA